jgi:hypothetical protein
MSSHHESREENLIDLECVICQSIPEPERSGFLHIFSCQQHHLLCGSCAIKVDQCPVCKQDFKTQSFQRNFLAERMATQMKANSSVAFSSGISKFIVYFLVSKCVTHHNYWCLLVWTPGKEIRDMINCSKFVCSKKLLDTILLLLDSVRANNF